MTDGHFSRRGFLAALAAGTAIAWLEAHSAELRQAGALAAAGGDDWLVLTPEQAAVLDAVTAQIVPTDGTPGAREAKVVRFIDRSLTTWLKPEHDYFVKVLDTLAAETKKQSPNAASFAALSDADQFAVLQALEKSDPDAFGGLRWLTMLGMFTNPSYGGNFEKTGWKMLGFIDQFAWSPPFGYYDRV
jgi:gluconate 2-dehydrogenase gamma chain